MAARYLIRLVGVFLFILILLHIDFSNIGFLISNADVFGLLIGILLVVPIMLIKGSRWFLITRGLRLNIRLTEAVDGLCIAQMTSFTLPGSLGDLVRVPYLKCRGNPSDRSILSLFIDAVVAAAIPYLAATIGIVLVFGAGSLFIAETLLLALCFVGGCYAFYRLIRIIVRPWWLRSRLSLLKSDGVVGRFFLNLQESVRAIGLPTIIVAVSLSGLAWFIFTLQSWILAEALHIHVTWLEIALSVTLASMLAVIPISIQGIGVREGILLLLMGGMFGVDPTSVILFSILLTIVSLTPSIWGLISWMRDPFVKLRPESVEVAIIEPSGSIVETEE